jgi:hypothetical protein
LSKVCAIARAVAVLLAIVGAFVTVPYLAIVLLLLGFISAITNTPENNTRIFLITIVLLLGAKTLAVIPTAGDGLASVFGNLGIALFGACVMAIVMGVWTRVRGDWAATT